MKSRKMKQQSKEARRSFLKKAAYAAPVVIGLGALSTPASAHGSNLANSKGPKASSKGPKASSKAPVVKKK